MHPVEHTRILTPGTFLVLCILALLTGVYFIDPPLNGALRPAAFVLVSLLVLALLIRELAARRQTEKAAHRAQSLNLELDERVAERTRQLETANRKLAAEITERERSTEELRLLAAHLQSAREEERIAMAREIHDEIGTLMTAIKMDLAFLHKEINGSNPPKAPETIRAEINATTKLVDNAIRTVHQIVIELRPAVLDHLGLRSALEWQVQEFRARNKIECGFNSDLAELQLDKERSTAVFRILQEALTNVARHAAATRVDVRLHEQDRQLIMQVQDNGKGISDLQLWDNGRFGLLGMRERAHIFGGDVNVHGTPGHGTTVTVRIPV